MWVARKLDAKPAERLRSKKLAYVEFRTELRRFYPHHELASHVVGSIGYVDGSDAERGSGGIESSFEEDLAGRPGEARVLTCDVHQTAYDSVVTRAPEAGADLTLSIDPNLQYEAERQLDKAIASSHARTGSIVAINPYTGDILAMANYPRYDPNLPPSSDADSAARSNLAISTPFEPGSVFKVVTLSAALETTNLTPDSLINCGNGMHQPVRPRDSRRSSLLDPEHGRRAGEIEQHRRDSNRPEDRRDSRSTNTRGCSDSARRPESSWRANRAATCGT